MLRVLHPNRWFFWTLSALVVAGGILIFIIQGSVYDLQLETLDSIYQISGWKTYRSAALRISVRYPPNWQIEVDPQEANTFTLQNPADYGENITFSQTEPKYEAIIRSSLEIDSEKSFYIDEISAAWLVGSNLQDRATSNVILLQVHDRLYYFAGNAKNFEKIVKSIRFTRQNFQ